MREEKQADERRRLEAYITERRGDIKLAEASKATMAKETDEMIIGERGRRQAEQERLEKERLLEEMEAPGLQVHSRRH